MRRCIHAWVCKVSFETRLLTATERTEREARWTFFSALLVHVWRTVELAANDL